MTTTPRPLLDYRAILFDLDGVITPTAELHRQAWRRMFSAFLEERGAEPYTEQDYFDHLDGRRRDEGVASLLASRGITLPEGSSDDAATVDSIHGLGSRKNQDFLQLVEEGVQPYPGSVELLDALAAAEADGQPVPRIGIVSSSKNAKPVLESAGLLDRFEIVVDGNVASEQGLKGKPAPDTYLRGAELLEAEPEDAVVVEDATSGVQSSRAGNFGLVLGVDRGAGEEALKAAGADLVVADLADLLSR